MSQCGLFNWSAEYLRREALAERCSMVRHDLGLRLVATGGCFDLLHPGHVRFLQAARRLGSRLLVCVNSDASARRFKGKGRPVIPQAERVEMLLALSCVSYVTLFEEDTPEAVLEIARPAIWAKGGDYAAFDLPERATVEGYGGQVVFLPEFEGYHTTALLERLR